MEMDNLAIQEPDRSKDIDKMLKKMSYFKTIQSFVIWS